MTDDRWTRLQAALAAGLSLRAFARQEGIAAQTLYVWLQSRPAYRDQVAAYRQPGASRSPVLGAEFWRRVEAYQRRQAGARWKEAARGLQINDAALRQWCRMHRAEIETALEQRQRRAA